MGNVSTGTRKVGDPNYFGSIKVARARYDFATDGGAISTITLRGDSVPSGAVVTDVVIEVAAAVTSGGAPTVSIDMETAADLRAAATLATAPALSTTGIKRSALVNGGTSGIRTTASRAITATVATATLTAGTFSVLVYYVELGGAAV